MILCVQYVIWTDSFGSSQTPMKHGEDGTTSMLHSSVWTKPNTSQQKARVKNEKKC